MSIDSTLKGSIDNPKHEVNKGDLLLFPMTLEDHRYQEEPFNHNIFGSQSENPTLEKILDQALTRLSSNPSLISNLEKHPMDNLYLKMKMLSYYVGPSLFNSVVINQLSYARAWYYYNQMEMPLYYKYRNLNHFIFVYSYSLFNNESFNAVAPSSIFRTNFIFK